MDEPIAASPAKSEAPQREELPEHVEFDNLRDLWLASQAGEINATAMIDNDSVSFYNPANKNLGFLELHPNELIKQALDLLGITWYNA